MNIRDSQQLVCDALQMAIWRRQPKAGLIHHSDRGSQYASKAFRRLLKAHGIEGSMSRKGDCWDNAVVESFFGSLKQERVQWRNYQSRYEGAMYSGCGGGYLYVVSADPVPGAFSVTVRRGD